MIVHLGCGDDRLTASCWEGETLPYIDNLVDEREIWGKYHMSYYHGKIEKQLDALEGE